MRGLKVLFVSIVLSAAAFAETLLPRPDISVDFDHPRVKMIAGLRPYRKGGIRMERESISSSLVLWHNYGHGGAGITLSWGTAEHVVQSAEADLLFSPRVVVLGAGAVGLSTAYLLTQLGHQVEIYSDKFHPDLTSDVAGGLWMPSSVDLESQSDRELTYTILRRSYEIFLDRSKAGFAVRPMKYFQTYVPDENEVEPFSLMDLSKRGILARYKIHDQLPIEGLERRGIEYSTLMMDMPTYIPQLQKSLENLGVVFVKRKFQNTRELQTTFRDEAVIFNCTGLGSRALFNDQNLIPIKGQLVWIERSPHDPAGPEDYMISSPAGYLFMRAGEYILGGTFEKEVWDPTPLPSIGKEILKAHQDFFELLP